MITTWTKERFEARCRRHGVAVSDAEASITKRNADGTFHADNTHPSYPRPSLAKRAANFAAATARHIANGGRQCTDKEIAARYAICEACPLLVDQHCAHRNCGCRISPKRAIVSKLSWGSESCPIGKWSAIDS